ncbi:MAG: SPFH domain-containing protein, partial [Bryobacteraceae bacterium]
MSFLSKQFIDVIQWTETGDGMLAYRYPMEDMEIQNGGKLTVRDSQMAVFVNEGRIADVFNPGLYTLSTNTLPLLTYLLNWDKGFKSPFKSDVYFFSTRLQIDQKWGTPTPITIRDKEFGAVRMRAFGIYSYRISSPKFFYEKISGTRQAYHVADLDGQLRNTIIGRMTNAFGSSTINFLDMAANQTRLAETMTADLEPVFADLGLTLE